MLRDIPRGRVKGNSDYGPPPPPKGINKTIGNALPFQHLHQGRHLPHAGVGQLFDGHQFIGVELFGFDAILQCQARVLRP